MKTVDRAVEVLDGRLARLRPVIRKILKRKPRPDAVVVRSRAESGPAWFYSGMLITDLAQLERLKQVSWNGRSPQEPEVEVLKQLADGRHAAYYRVLLAKFFTHELAACREVLAQWKEAGKSVRSGSGFPEEISPEAVAQGVESFWELLIAADFCEQHHVLGKDSRTVLPRLSRQLVKTYAQLPSKTRHNAAWYVNNFAVSVRFHPTETCKRGFAGIAARLLGAVCNASSPTD